MKKLKDISSDNKILIAAHRGSSGSAPDNTLPAFKLALDSGVDMIELDLQLSLDEKFVVYHDFFPSGSIKKLSELNYDDIKKINISSEFDKYTNEYIPLLEDILDIISGKCYLMIEIKSMNGNRFLKNSKKLIELLKERDFLDYSLFGSFNYEVLVNLKKINSDVITAAIKLPGDTTLPSIILQQTKSDAYICSILELNPEIKEDIINNNIFTGVYGIETEEQIQLALDYKVRAVATNYPEKIKEMLNSLKY